VITKLPPSTRLARAVALVGGLIAVAALIAWGDSEATEPIPPSEVSEVEELPTGCDPGKKKLVTEGPRSPKRVALTFDDGPGDLTLDILEVLRRKQAQATFFVIGREIPGREEILSSMWRHGHEIGNHSTSHQSGPGADDIAGTSRLIEEATGFRPCLFRPPGGVVDEELVREARQLGMATVLWNVDPHDWNAPDRESIRAGAVEAAKPGAIILMHDGGGDRRRTLEALPRVIDELRENGYELVTVTELLGGKLALGSAG
jgi:peptidoglycan/xylan/chitin deacetylase (PgdA/CDA1 family)